MEALIVVLIFLAVLLSAPPVLMWSIIFAIIFTGMGIFVCLGKDWEERVAPIVICMPVLAAIGLWLVGQF